MKIEQLRERKSEMEVLKANKTSLSPEEREKVMKAGAVWHHGPGGKKSPGIWKSKDSKGKIKYVSNTHRLYKVADTLSGAISNFPAVKASA